MCTQPDTAGHLLNIYIEPSVPANASSQGGYASEPAAAKVDMLRLSARAPTIPMMLRWWGDCGDMHQ